MKRRLTSSSSTELSLECLPAPIVRLVLGHNYELIPLLASLSSSLYVAVHVAYPLRCQRLACAAWIVPPQTYYALAGGRVLNCARCAGDVLQTVTIGVGARQHSLTFRRGWDEVAHKAPWLNLRRVAV